MKKVLGIPENTRNNRSNVIVTITAHRSCHLFLLMDRILK